jgi:hypothetical protein
MTCPEYSRGTSAGDLTGESQSEVLFHQKGCKQLAEDAVYWERLSSIMGRVLATGGKGTE